MNNNIEIFRNAEFGEIRTVIVDDEPWFVGKDVAEALGYSDATKAVRTHVEKEDKIMGSQNGAPSITDNLGRTQYPTWINESGLYSLILSSKLSSAKEFKHWVTSDVLPSIRKHGAYMTSQTIEEVFKSPDFIIQLATQLKNEQEARKAAENKVEEQQLQLEEQKPKVEFADHVSESENLITMEYMAKLANDEHINVGRNKLFSWLREQKILKFDNVPYQNFIDKGYFKVRESTFRRNNKFFTQQTTYVTGKGQLYIIKKLKKEFGTVN